MKKYFLKEGNRERGPFMLDDLKYQRISKSTFVKIDDGDWEPLIENADLRSLLDLKKDNFVADSPEKKSGIKTNVTKSPQANRKLVIGLAVFFLLISVGMAFYVFMMAKG